MYIPIIDDIFSAKNKMEQAKKIYGESTKKLENQTTITATEMDKLGTLEVTVLNSFEEFSDMLGKIHNKPDFKEIYKDTSDIPVYTPEELKEVSVGAGALLGGLAGAGLGVAGGLAASGATTAAVTALATASTGTAISALSGAAATNATLAFLGGGSLAAGGGGIALGSVVLSTATFGVGLIVGGAIFALSSIRLSNKADEALKQAKTIESEATTTCNRLKGIYIIGQRHRANINRVNRIYKAHMRKLDEVIYVEGHTDWNTFSEHEKQLIQNTVLLVGLLYSMCKVEVTLYRAYDKTIRIANDKAVIRAESDAKAFLATMNTHQK